MNIEIVPEGLENPRRGAITITASRCVENFAGMEKIGDQMAPGFTGAELEHLHRTIQYSELIKMPCPTQPDLVASVLIIRNGVWAFHMNPRDLYDELAALDWDKKFKSYGTVKNRDARYNLCFARFSQEPDYEAGKGRVINLDSLHYLGHLMNYLHCLIGEKGRGLLAEGNYYYDVNKCYIGFHGDKERKMVVGIRVGEPIPLYYQWYQQTQKIGEEIMVMVNEGDIYIMDEKATGNDAAKRIIPTIRHAAGKRENYK